MILFYIQSLDNNSTSNVLLLDVEIATFFFIIILRGMTSLKTILKSIKELLLDKKELEKMSFEIWTMHFPVNSLRIRKKEKKILMISEKVPKIRKLHLKLSISN